MTPLTPEQSEQRVTMASRGDDNDGETVKEHPVVGLQVLTREPPPYKGRRYRFEGLGRKKDRKLRFAVIGASRQCHIRLDDARVSAVHCMISHNVRTQRVYIHDASSTNGLHVNGVRVAAAELDPGDTIQIGDTFLYAFGSHEPQAKILITAHTVREFVERAAATLGSERATADAIEIPRSTLRDWLKKDDE